MFGNALIVFVALGVLINNFIIEYQMETQAEDPRELLAQIVVVSTIASSSTLGGMLLVTKYLAEKNWQTFMDNTWDGKPLCVGAQRFKALPPCVCQFFMPPHLPVEILFGYLL